MRRSLRPLAVREYRLMFSGAALSNAGTWMQRVAIDWLVYQQTNSPAWVGLVTFAMFAPVLFVSPLAGVAADRFDRRRVLLGAQAFMMTCTAVLTALTYLGLVTPVLILVLSLGVGIGFAVHAPTWQSTVPHLVPREMLTSAVALNSAQVSMARIAGPAAGGLLVAVIGVAGVFALNTLSFLAVIAALLVVRLPGLPSGPNETVRQQLRSGLRYAYEDRTILWLITAVTVVSLVAAPLTTLLPVYARDILGGDASTLGLLTGALGAGSLLGALLLGPVAERVNPPALVGGALIAVAACTALVGLAPGLALTAAALVATGLFRLSTVAATNSGIQLRADERYRGRVMSLFMLGFGGLFPLGALGWSSAASVWGVQAVTLTMALCTGLAGLVVWQRLQAHDMRNRVAVEGVQPV